MIIGKKEITPSLFVDKMIVNKIKPKIIQRKIEIMQQLVNYLETRSKCKN